MNPSAQLLDTPRELLGGGMVKGGMMAAHIDWATKARSLADINRFWTALPSNLRESLSGMLLPVSWFQFADLMEVDRTIVKVYGGGDTAVLREVGAYSARSNLTGVYKAFRATSIHEFFDNGASLHSKFQDFGEASYVMTSRVSGQMVHSGYCSYSPLFCESALGYYRESLLLHRAVSVQVDETSCQCRGARSCTFSLRWR
ncbi:MAG: hypothetical protein AABO58_21080 [Acidobacteriota bacterium]